MGSTGVAHGEKEIMAKEKVEIAGKGKEGERNSNFLRSDFSIWLIFPACMSQTHAHPLKCQIPPLSKQKVREEFNLFWLWCKNSLALLGDTPERESMCLVFVFPVCLGQPA